MLQHLLGVECIKWEEGGHLQSWEHSYMCHASGLAHAALVLIEEVH